MISYGERIQKKKIIYILRYFVIRNVQYFRRYIYLKKKTIHYYEFNAIDKKIQVLEILNTTGIASAFTNQSSDHRVTDELYTYVHGRGGWCL